MKIFYRVLQDFDEYSQGDLLDLEGFLPFHPQDWIDDGKVEQWIDETPEHERWNDLRCPMSAGRANTSPPTMATFRDGLITWSYSASQVNQLYFEAQLPHGWVNGSEIRPHIHWSPGNSTNTGNVKWQLEYSWSNAVNAPDNVFEASTTLTAVQAASGTPYTHQIAQFPGIDGTGMRDSSVLLCRIARVGDDVADTFTGAAYGISFDLHYQIASSGSVTEYPAS